MFLIAGSVLGVVFSNYDKVKYTIHDIEHFFLQALPLIFIIGSYSLYTAGLMVANKIVKSQIKYPTKDI